MSERELTNFEILSDRRLESDGTLKCHWCFKCLPIVAKLRDGATRRQMDGMRGEQHDFVEYVEAYWSCSGCDHTHFNTKLFTLPCPSQDGRCHDCARPYKDECGFPKLMVTDLVWQRISPTGDGKGLLCPSCMARRCAWLDIKTKPWWASGPFQLPEEPVRGEIGIQREYQVKRVDGTHEHATYFVLDMADPHTIPALLAFAEACEGEKPVLASEIRETVEAVTLTEQEPG